ncbi:MAG TPA: PQQ-binding-like beta-propeller repeat protein, partial [Rhodothermia bacterium]|nr:PQQ-binding-like beta-propeller repeat protein [Rhodothermia bacterium]
MRHLLAATLPALLAAGCQAPPDPGQNPAYRTWEVYLGDKASTQYSSLDQISRRNVDQLEVAWTYRADEIGPDDRTQIQCNPIVVEGTLYGTSPRLKVFALDAATGLEKWKFDPFASGAVREGPGINRGVVYWAADDGSDARIFMVAGSQLFALDAGNGAPIASFGTNGSVDLHEGLDRDTRGLFITARTPGIIYRDLLIMGSTVDEGPIAAPGHVRAFDVRTGEIVWIFHTIPHPGEFGYDTWPDSAYKRIGGANAWTGLTVDEERGLVFIPTGSASFDFWGGNRVGENLFANSVIALKAETGERIWHFQTVHHDIWDRDHPAPPNLVTVEHDGERIDAVAQITKSGYVFLFDRETGEPLFSVEEKSYPPSDLLGEVTWPTQPFPVKPPPFARQEFNEDLVTDRTPEARAAVLETFRKSRSGGQFVPPSTEGTIIFPGFDGGGEWGGAAWDPTSSLLYVNSNEMAWILQMVELSGSAQPTGRDLYMMHCAACHGPDRKGSSDQSFPTLENVSARMTEDQISNQIALGKGFMPSFGFLSEQERIAITEYVVSPDAASTELPRDSLDYGKTFAGSPYGHTGYNRFFDPDGYPAVKPPWGTLNAIDLNQGEIVWTVPLGEYDELSAQGIPQTGTENYGGPVVTAGGLLFIGATKDERFRAFDKDTGEMLWQTDLPAGGYATPATYEVDGKQYVVIA